MTLVTLDALKEYVKEPTSSDRHDETLEYALESASEKIQDYCDRIFIRDDLTGSPSVTDRVYTVLDPYRLHIRDVYDLTGLVVKTDQTDDGVYDTTWTETTDYVAGPYDQRDGWPFYIIEAVGGRSFRPSRRATVQVSALYGWATIPGPVEQTCLELAAELWKRRDAPFGVVGLDDFGAIRIGDSDRRLTRRLDAYRRFPVLLA